MPPVVDTANVVAVAQGASRIGKTLLWAPKGVADGVWRGCEAADAGVWRKPSEVNAGRDSAIPKKYRWHLFTAAGSDDARFALRSDLATRDDTALTLGVIAPQYMDLLTRSGDSPHYVSDFGALARRKGVFIDAPRAWFTLDCDALDLRLVDKHVNLIEDDSDLPDLFADALDRMGLDWLISDFTMHLSSSHGLRDTHTMRAHIEWRLDQPLTLAEQKRIAAHINARAEAAGFGRIADPIIYNPNQLLFTSPVALKKRVWVPGKGIVLLDADGPKPVRVRLVHRGSPRIDVPGDVLSLLTGDEKVAKVRALTQRGSDPQGVALGRQRAGATEPGENILEPGNVYKAVRARIYSRAMRTPQHLAQREIEKLRACLAKEIEALPDSDAAILTRRLCYIAPQEMQRSWDHAVAKRRPWTAVAGAQGAHAKHAANEARVALTTTIRECVQRAIGAYQGSQEPQPDGAILTTPPPVVHTLIRVPPGVGKTHAALACIRHEHLTLHRISYLSPTMRLSEEAADRRRLSLPKHDEHAATLVRHHKGRAHLCIDAEYGRLAAKVEKVGRSPLQSVCGVCPKRDACKWPVQHSDHGSGLVAGQHAHATTSLARLHPDSPGAPTMGIVDESMLGTLLQQTQKARRLETLRRATRKTSVRNKAGDLLRGATANAISYRDRALDIVAKSQRVVTMKAVAYFRPEITIRRSDEAVRRARIADAIHCEREVTRTADHAIRAALEEHHKAKAEGRPTRRAERALSTASNALLVSEWFTALYRAIEASLSAPGRAHVFGVRVFGHKDRRVSVHLRAHLPSVFTNRHWLWLDGTANESVWRASLGPNGIVGAVVSLRVQPGPYHLTQYPDRAYSKKMFLRCGDSDHGNSHLQRLRHFIHHLAVAHKAVLVVAQLPLIRALGAMPDNVNLEHFNALRGIDVYKDTPCAVIIGRSLPKTGDLEAMAEALHYDDPSVESFITAGDSPLGGHRTIRTATGAVQIPCERHPDVRVEALRQQVVDTEVEQAINRLRLYDRKPGEPAEIHVFGQVDTGLPVHALADWTDAQREPSEIIEASGVWSQKPEIIQKLASGLLADRSPRILRRLLTRSPQVEAWPCWGIQIEGSTRHWRVWVDTRRHGAGADAVRRAIERETGLTVLSLKTIVFETQIPSEWDS